MYGHDMEQWRGQTDKCRQIEYKYVLYIILLQKKPGIEHYGVTWGPREHSMDDRKRKREGGGEWASKTTELWSKMK